MLERETWALGQRDRGGILRSGASELCVAVARSRLAVPGLSFLNWKMLVKLKCVSSY